MPKTKNRAQFCTKNPQTSRSFYRLSSALIRSQFVFSLTSPVVQTSNFCTKTHKSPCYHVPIRPPDVGKLTKIAYGRSRSDPRWIACSDVESQFPRTAFISGIGDGQADQ